ncbi:hypothetical protein QBC47DRAFT_406425 [Echria macrotheca]|uniref:Uncharacterized protein n=1 Tax=Echria macrotheca TaxID=438768 RepID=A0AAJ0F7H8_9PEZI|nr:hypothetical protein QBC47DRAFT_406425 [Echria macrotheca]
MPSKDIFAPGAANIIDLFKASLIPSTSSRRMQLRRTFVTPSMGLWILTHAHAATFDKGFTVDELPALFGTTVIVALGAAGQERGFDAVEMGILKHY